MIVEWRIKAKEEFKNILFHISLDYPKYSYLFLEKIFEVIENISKYNQLGKIVYEFNNENIREINFWSYRFIYQIYEDKIVILSILHSRRNFDLKK